MRSLNRLRTALVLGFLGLLLADSVPARTPGSEGSDELSALLKRIFASREFMPKRFGPARSISEGEGTSLHIHSLLARYLLEHLPAGPRPR